MGTKVGLFKIDKESKQIEYYNSYNSDLPANYINCIETKQNKVFIGTAYGGLAIIENEQFTIINTLNSQILSDKVKYIAIDSGFGIWFFAGNHIYYMKNDVITMFDESNSPFDNSNPDIFDIAVDNEDQLWVAQFFNLWKYDQSEWIAFDDEDGFDGNWLIQVEVDDYNNIWIASMNDLYKYDGVTFSNVDYTGSNMVSDNIQSLHKGKNNKIWILTFSDLVKLDNNTATVYNHNNSEFPTFDLTHVFEESTNNIWIGTFDSGLGNFYNSNWNYVDISNSILPTDDIEDICIGNNNNKWIALGTRGLIKITSSNIWELLTHDNSSLPYFADVKTIHCDNNNTIWIGTADDGLVKVTNDEWTIITTSSSDLPSNTIVDINSDIDGNIWCTTGHGLCKISNDDYLVFYPVNSALPSYSISQVETYDNIVWVMAEEGLVKFEGGIGQLYEEEDIQINPERINCIEVDDNGTLWVGTRDGVIIFNGTDWMHYNFNLLNHYINNIKFDKFGNYWFSIHETSENNDNIYKLIKKDGSNWITYSSTNSTLHNAFINNLAIDNCNNYWFSTFYGISIYNESEVDLFSKEIKSQDKLCHIFPNPCSSKLTIQTFDKKTYPCDYYITNAKGVIVKSGNINSKLNEINIKSLNEGVYFISFSTKEYCYTEKFIKN